MQLFILVKFINKKELCAMKQIILIHFIIT